MKDGMSGIRAQGPRVDTRILRHMLMETSALLEESQTLAAQRDQDGRSARALSEVTRRLLSVSSWLSGQFMGEGAAESVALRAAAAGDRSEAQTLSPALRALCEQVERLHDRAVRLDELLHEPAEPLMRLGGEAHESETAGAAPAGAEVIEAFGAGPRGSAAVNPVLAARQRLKWAFRFA